MQLRDYHCHLSSHTHRPSPAGRQTLNHRHDFYELGVVAKGCAHWVFDRVPDGEEAAEAVVPINGHEAILVPPKRFHFESAVALTSFLWVGFDAPASALQKIPAGKAIALKGWSSEVMSGLKRLHLETLRQPEGYRHRIPLLLADLLIVLERAATAMPALRTAISQSDQIETARMFLEQNPVTELSIEQVARYHGYSLPHFEVLFSRRFGTSPKRYHQSCKLRAVTDCIRGGLRSPKMLAARFGFSDAAYFCRWFRKETGTTPSRYAPPDGNGLASS